MEIQEILRLIILVKYIEFIISTRKTLFSQKNKGENPMGREIHPIPSHPMGYSKKKTVPWDGI